MANDKIQWIKSKVLKVSDAGPEEDHIWQYEVVLPDFLASWDILSSWEKERFLSMEKHLKKGDILFDCGVEAAWQSAIYAQFVGGENMVLIEPETSYWPNIKQMWQHNNLPDPKGCFAGFVSDKSSEGVEIPKGWPKEAEGQELRKGLTYRYVHENRTDTPAITIDEYVRRTGIVPDAITMDCEGVEQLILRGSDETLRRYHPQLFVSIHDDLAEKNYGVKPGETNKYLESLGYTGEFLELNHEAHWRWYV